MNQRTYNKIYTSKNRTQSQENIFLGYQYNENETILRKDKETYFHVPPFADPISLVDTDLIINGAIAGSFPAASDRVFKSLKSYGEVSHHGTVFAGNGMWFCSWLYQNPDTGESQWMDRFYQPGKFDYNKALNQLFTEPVYIKTLNTDSIFKDVPSTMIFEPGVLYRYFHLGEKTAQSLVDTFAGVDKSKLKLHLNNWTETDIDSSNNNLTVSVRTNAATRELVSSPQTQDGVRIFAPTINFNNKYNTEAKVEYNQSYLFENEFTWSFWAYSEDWQASPSTQLVGNLSTKGGGIGVFLDTLETFPVTVIPETKYGHVIYINENGSAYLDKNVQPRATEYVSPICFGIDSNNHIIVANDDASGVIYKMDHVGRVLNTTKSVTDTSSLFNFPLSGERPKQVLCGLNDDFYVVTNRAVHTFNANFALKSSVSVASESDTNVKAAFRYNISLGTVALDISTNVYDVIFDQETKWSISALDGNLYKNDQFVYSFPDIATKLSIGPDKNLYIAHGANNVTVLDPVTMTVVRRFDIGSENIQQGKVRKKSISFIKRYSRSKQTSVWNLVVFYNDEKLIYYYELTGKISKTLDMSVSFDAALVQRLNQNVELCEFNAEGDFTGYERQRIFSKLPPYSNSQQICVKISPRNTAKAGVTYSAPIKGFGSISNWQKDSWKHFLLIYRNKTAELFCDNVSLVKVSLNGNEQINYDTQPSLFVGCPTGSVFGMNTEIGWPSNIFNGKIGDVKIFNYALDPKNNKLFEYSTIVLQDLTWPMPIPSTQYVEEIERVFKHKLPGSKSQFFKLKITGSGIKDETTRKIVEAEILATIKESKPAYSDLVKIEWYD